MKVLVIAVVLLASLIAIQCDDINVLSPFIAECKNENNVSDEESEAMHEGRMDTSKASNNLKCATKCLLENTKIMVNGELIAENAMTYVEDMTLENVKLTVDNCNKESGIDECDDAFHKVNCLYRGLHFKKP